jgi:hypothetical protein
LRRGLGKLALSRLVLLEAAALVLLATAAGYTANMFAFEFPIRTPSLVCHITEIGFVRCIGAADRFKFCKTIPPGEVG